MGAPTELYQPYKAEHAEPKGKGDQRPTTEQVLKDAGSAADLQGKVILITGASSGVGLEAAKALHTTGAQLYLTARNMDKLNELIKSLDQSKPKPVAIEMSLDSLASVKKGAEAFKQQSDRLDILITNAGVMFAPATKTEDGFERHFGTNHLGHFLFFQLLKPLMLKTAAETGTARLVVVSSAGHRRCAVDFDDIMFEKRPYDGLNAYCQSKCANVWFANEADRRYAAQGLRAVSLHPGIIITDLGRTASEEQLTSVGVGSAAVARVEKSWNQGAATTVWAAVDPYFKTHGGVYLGDIGVCGPGSSGLDAVYAPHAYDEAGEKKLWQVSCGLVGIEDE